MTRRRLLGILVGFLLLLVGLVTSNRRRWERVLTVRLGPRLDPSSPTGILAADERATIIAFAEILVEGRALSEAQRGYMAEHVNDRTQTRRGYLALYRASARLLDRVAGTSFASLPFEARMRLVAERGLAGSRPDLWDYVLPWRRQVLAHPVLTVPDLIWGYYQSPEGWATVGYATFPGRCGDLSRYTLREGEA